MLIKTYSSRHTATIKALRILVQDIFLKAYYSYEAVRHTSTSMRP
jgi:hypothetical protein